MPEDKINLHKITFTFKEGFQHEKLPVSVSTWWAANMILSRWAMNAPQNGSYDKIDFQVEWEDGTTHEGRYDLVHTSIEAPCLIRHVREFLEFQAGIARPSHMTEERYAMFLARFPASLAEGCAKILSDYTLGDQ